MGRGELVRSLGEAGWQTCSYDTIARAPKLLKRFPVIFGGFNRFLPNRRAHFDFFSQLSPNQVYIHPSSRAVYKPACELVEESPFVSQPSKYARQKMIEEELLDRYPARMLVLRLPNILSAEVDFSQNKFFSIFCRNAFRLATVRMSGSPSSIKDFLCVEDLSFVIEKLVTHDAGQGVYNVSYGNGGTSMEEFVEFAAQNIGPLKVVYEKGEMEEFSLDNTKLISVIKNEKELRKRFVPSLHKIYQQLKLRKT